jgi:O-antigen/teichoic acid export membrane protein
VPELPLLPRPVPDGPLPGPGPGPANASGRQLLRNITNSYASFFIGLAMTLVLTRVLLHHLGAGTYGLWVVLLALVGYLGLLDVGVGTAAVQRVARLTANNDTRGMADLIRTTWIFFAVSAVLAVLITVGLAPFVASFLNLGGVSSSLAGATLIILGVMSALMFLSTVPNAVLFGSGRNDRQTQIGLITMLLVQVGQIVAMVAGAGLMAVAVLQTAGVAVTLVISASIVHRITGASMRHGHFSRRLLRELLSFGGVQTVVALGGVVAYQLDSLVIGIILPVAQVAPYNVALNTSNFTRTLSTQATTSLLPAYAHFEEVGERERQATYFFRAVMGCLVISTPIVIALAAFGDPILKLWLGTVPPKTYEIMIALGLVTALQLPGHQCFLFLTGTGRNRAMVRLAIIGAAANLAGSIAATYWLGPVGPAVGSLPVVLILDSMVLPTRVCRYLGVSVRSYVRTALVPVVPVALAAGVTALALIHLHPEHSGIEAIIGAVIVCAVAWITLAAIVSRTEPELRNAVLQRIRSRRGAPS